MTELQPYLALRGPWGCLELVNQTRTLTYLEHGNRGPIELIGCGDCQCDAFRPLGTTPDDADHPAPWFDPLNPDSGFFYGLYGAITIGPFAASNSSRPRQRLTFTGIGLSSCDGGGTFSWQWLRRILDGNCVGCRDLALDVFTRCGAADNDAPVWPNVRPDPSHGSDCCAGESAPGLPPSTPAAVPVDTGMRTIPRARYVTGSLQTVTEDSGDWPTCHGTRITFSFDIDAPAAYHQPVEVCTITDPIELETAGGCCGCHDLRIWDGYPADCGRCGRDCVCVSTPNTLAAAGGCSVPTRYADPAVERCRWSRPLQHTRITCITPSVAYDMAVPIVELSAGVRDVDVMVTLWDAHPGLPDPRTCDGEKVYDLRAPLVEPIGVRLPAGTRVILDGRTQQVLQWCAGRTSAAPELARAVDGSAFRLPSLCCGRRAWVAVDADCYAPPGPGFGITTALAGAVLL